MHKPRSPSRAALRWGFTATIALALAAWTISVIEVHAATANPDRLESVATQLERGVRRSGALIEGLLAFSRPLRAQDANPSASLPGVIHEVVDDLGLRAVQSKATLEVDVADVAVAWPTSLVHVVVANLLGNALKFIDGCPVRHIAVTARTESGAAEIVVEDSGPGIPRESLVRIFEPFYRVPGGKVGGTGIGLATVRRIVDAYGGTIEVESEPGSGSVFRVRLPLGRKDPASPEHVPAPASDVAVSGVGRG